MNSARIAARRPIFRSVNAPSRPRPQLRHYAREQASRSKAEADAFGASSKSALRPDVDYVSVHRAEAMRRAKAIKRRNWLVLGAALSMIAPIFLVRLWDLPEPNNEKGEKEEDKGSNSVIYLIKPRPTQADAPRKAADEFQGKKVVIAAGDKIIAAPADAANPQPSDADAVELVGTGTSYVPYFPRTIRLPTSSGQDDIQADAEYTLLGLGIRKVSFLRVQVYVVGLYVKTSTIGTLQNQLINTVNPTASTLIAGEKEDLRQALLDPERSTQIWESILARQGTDGVDMAFRLVPTRGTDFNHLRDGLMNAIKARTDETKRKQADLLRQQAAESKQIALPKPVDANEFSDESFGLAMKQFRDLFQGRGKAPKGSIIILARDSTGTLEMMYQNLIKTNKGEKVGKLERLGEIKDDRVSRLVWSMYLAGKNVSSEEARQSIVDGCIHIVERPVGTVEGMVQ